jgi:hypothetical protein
MSRQASGVVVTHERLPSLAGRRGHADFSEGRAQASHELRLLGLRLPDLDHDQPAIAKGRGVALQRRRRQTSIRSLSVEEPRMRMRLLASGAWRAAPRRGL